MASDLESRIKATGHMLYDYAEGEKPSLFKKDFWTGKMMDWSMKNDAFKTEMFRFVDVFPYLTRPESVARHLQEYFCRPDQDFPKAMQWGLKMVSPTSMAAKMAAKSIAKNIAVMGRQFIVGEDLTAAAPVMKGFRDQGFAWTMKILKEAITSRLEEEQFVQQQIDFLDEFEGIQRDWPALGNHSGDLDWGSTPKANISLMVSCLCSQYTTKACALDYALDYAKERLRPILRKAMQVKAYVLVDMEHLAAREFTLAIFRGIKDEPEFRDYPHLGIAYQAYLQDSRSVLADLLKWARKGRHDIGIRLVKGAFWDEEVVSAHQYNYPVPVYTNKHATDASFESCARMILENHRHTALQCASHNIRSVAHTLETARDLKVPEDRYEFQMLHGMAENLRRAWQKAGLRLRLYAPIGELIPGMAYNVRRLLENTSNESFLRLSFAEGAARDDMLRDPAEKAAADQSDVQAATTGAETPFANQTPLEWSADDRQQFQRAIEKARRSFPQQHPLVVNGQAIDSQHRIQSANPNRPEEIVGTVAAAGTAEAQKAVAAAKSAFDTWRRAPAAQRSDVLFKTAAAMRRQRHELAAMLVLESGKNWNEAQADVNEAVDVLEYYGRQMLNLAEPRQTAEFPGESSVEIYRPRGVGAVIAPWNFALPISTGMIAAAVVTGNTVVYKPASDTPVIGALIHRLFETAGLPKGALNYLPGDGETVGGSLATHPDVAFVCFTGSREVGLKLIQASTAAGLDSGTLRPVFAEMGGKNAIIVDADADVDSAVGPIVQSAFGYMGQKCSACSRLIVLEENYERFMAKFKAAAESLNFGPAEIPETDLGAVINAAARTRLEAAVAEGRQVGEVLFELKPAESSGHTVPMVVLGGIDPDHPLATEELFGPVVLVFKVDDFDQALTLANRSRYALAGGVFSRSPGNIAKAQQEFQVGSLYINRGITGALAGRHPFGGFKQSGTGAKALGPDYLKQFMVSRTVVENTFRSGFAPLQTT